MMTILMILRRWLTRGWDNLMAKALGPGVMEGDWHDSKVREEMELMSEEEGSEEEKDGTWVEQAWRGWKEW